MKADLITGAIEVLLDDLEFKQLAKNLSSATIFHVIKAENNELIHSRILAWLLDPAQPHGLDGRFLRCFLQEAARAARRVGICYSGSAGEPFQPLQAEVFSLSDVNVRLEYRLPNGRRPDIVMSSQSDGWLCVIENKIEAGENPGQTAAYYDELQRVFPRNEYRYRVFVYLTPRGDDPVSPDFVSMNYGAVIDAFASVEGAGVSPLGRTVLYQYRRCLEANMNMNDDKLRKICWRLYQRHRAAVDAIYRYGQKSVLAVEVRTRVLKELELSSISSGALKWDNSDGNDWIALWPKHWPTRKGYYPAYYVIRWDASKTEDAITIGPGFDSPDGPHVRKRFEELAGDAANAILHPAEVSAKGLEDLDRAIAIADGARKFVALVEKSLDLIERAYREALPKPWKEKDDEFSDAITPP